MSKRPAHSLKPLPDSKRMSHSDDNEARRHALYAKRDSLRAQQAERIEQSRRNEQVAAFQQGLGQDLDAAGVRHEVLWPWTAPRRGPVERYPIGFASIHWPLVPDAVSRFGGDDQSRKELLDEALADLGIPPGRQVTVDWYVERMPRVVMSAADLSAQALRLLRASHDTWVYDANDSWVIEVYHEGDVTHARGPGRHEDAGDGWRPTRRGNQGQPSASLQTDEPPQE